MMITRHICTTCSVHRPTQHSTIKYNLADQCMQELRNGPKMFTMKAALYSITFFFFFLMCWKSGKTPVSQVFNMAH